ncbi:NAD(P)-dependent dehydrogenase, short-chain alcohol dehydrogenase family [Allopseudospirillum japonicum]|uniref:NAD(P)-dependent dehydrogenase, short-chain alcohol dehydrogenase family n=1 Tax=Allopseudospirillum japonicum TaxID=64971 RepID=A0A1H6UB38_9GAMM|nr:glucose 1-dehydrogenase [Allopseudospirillum japonicum]SEI85445.1 NAD(P)-dependent dehydrogenase, short-chain alcohol dehydrogenase family [Allopseudospirillum japonicum]
MHTTSTASAHTPVAIVTGGAQGIGRAICGTLLTLGYQVMIADIDVEAGQECKNLLMDLGPILFHHTDISHEDSIAFMVDMTLERFGRLDLLVNNAGLAVPFTGPIEDLSLATWNQYLSVHLSGSFLCAKYAISALRESRGSIINIASTRALQSEPDTEAYAAAKGGVLALTHALAMSLAPEVRVNSISPGWIEVGDWQKKSVRTEPVHSERDLQQHPVGRIGRPDDVASLVAYLASDAAGFITGQNFVVDGGMTRKMIYAED